MRANLITKTVSSVITQLYVQELRFNMEVKKLQIEINKQFYTNFSGNETID